MRRVLAVCCLILIGGDSPRGTEVTLDGLTAAVPSSWKAEPAATRGRLYQFQIGRVSGDKEDAELVILKLPPSPAVEQIAKLKDLFLLPTSLPKDQAVREWTIKNSKAVLTCLDIQGTYHPKKNSVDAAVREVRPDYRLLAAVWISPEGSYLIRLLGPKRTVSVQAAAFDTWLRNFK